jgi:hypothetical protein
MIHAINDYRKSQGKDIIWAWDGLVSHFCREHCWAMAREGKLYHAPDYYLGDWAEAIVKHSYNGEDVHQLGKKIMFDIIHNSPGHRDIVLKDELAVAYVINDWNLYLCVRGK